MSRHPKSGPVPICIRIHHPTAGAFAPVPGCTGSYEPPPAVVDRWLHLFADVIMADLRREGHHG
jgi:hypothetical protein